MHAYAHVHKHVKALGAVFCLFFFFSFSFLRNSSGRLNLSDAQDDKWATVKFKSLCLQGKHFTNQAAFQLPKGSLVDELQHPLMLQQESWAREVQETSLTTIKWTWGVEARGAFYLQRSCAPLAICSLSQILFRTWNKTLK